MRGHNIYFFLVEKNEKLSLNDPLIWSSDNSNKKPVLMRESQHSLSCWNYQMVTFHVDVGGKETKF